MLADAGHMLTDVAGIYLSLFAIWFIPKPPTPSKTYGYVRLEMLAALANGVLLLNMAAFILNERTGECGSIHRLCVGYSDIEL